MASDQNTESRLKTALADRYMINREIGSGGMATVYLAKDIKHERDVAVKVLRPELAAALGAERFLREIKITAGLNHPHILPLLDSGEADSFLFYVMPFVDGETLREKMEREGQLGTDDALRFTEQVASALAHAHSKNIVHRDIKPENLLLQEDNVAIADFGIALAVESAGGNRLTETGLSLGTPSYMSPEQVAGEQGIDLRSDIYSLACVLYEMLAGDPPFTASNSRAVLAKHLTDPAPPVTTVRPGVSGPVAAAVAKALEKAPADRFDSAKAFAAAWSSKPVADVEEQAKSIVVLPFANMSPDPDNEYFSDGLTEEVTSNLSQIHSLRVTSRTSAMALKGTQKDVRTIGRELGVRFLLEGSVRKAGNNLRITAQLVDAESDVHMWGGKYTGVMDDVFEMQEEVSRSIVDALELELRPDEERRLSERVIDNVQAYECYLRAKSEVWRMSEDSDDRALALLERAIAIAGDNDLVYAAKGRIYFNQVDQMNRPPETFEGLLEQAQTCAEKAFAFNPDSAPAHALQGFISQQRGDIPGLYHHFSSALRLDPNNFEANMILGYWRTAGGWNLEGARKNFEKCIRTDPLNPMSKAAMGWRHWFDGDFNAATLDSEGWQQVAEEAKSPYRVFFAFLHVANGNMEEAIRLVDLMRSDSPQHTLTALGTMLKHAWLGEREQALEAVTERIEQALWWDDIWSLLLAGGYAQIGENDRAIRWLDHSIDVGIYNVEYIRDHDPFLHRLHGDDRLPALLEKAERLSRSMQDSC